VSRYVIHATGPLGSMLLLNDAEAGGDNSQAFDTVEEAEEYLAGELAALTTWGEDVSALTYEILELVPALASTHTPPLEGQTYRIVPDIDQVDSSKGDPTYAIPTDDLEEATVITSRVAGEGDLHKVVLDIDLPAQLIPSSTPGHFHLYIDKEIPWREYRHLLHALANAGVIEEGYAGASTARGYTAARLPWVRKPEPEVGTL